MIAIRVVSRSGVALERLSLGTPLVGLFGDTVGDIGRGADCTLVLPDPDRQLSRKQALITSRGGRHFICPVGTHVAVELDGRPLEPNVESALEIGAEVRIGPYLLRVESAAEPPAAPPAEPPPAVTPARPPEDPLAIVGVAGGRSSVFADLLAETSAAVTAQAGTPAAADAAPRTRRRKKANADAAPDGERVAAPQRQKAPPDDPIATLFSRLGVPLPADRDRLGRQTALVADLLRATIGGTLELLAARTIAKRELGAEATQLQARENNPLKFSTDVDFALAQLLGPPQPGFIAPLDAVRDAFGDLRAHELAMLTGMRAALDEVLARFDPAALEPRLTGEAIWQKLVPAARKARLWEQYSQQYAQILREVEGDFDTLFNRAFLRAYRAQLAELARSARAARADDPGRRRA